MKTKMKHKGILFNAILLLAGAVVLAACSDDGNGFGSGDASGEGSATLQVIAEIEAEPRDGETALLESNLEVEFEVDVQDADGNDVDAEVTITSALGEVVLTPGDCGRAYCGEQLEYGQVYELAVVAGDDWLSGVVITGPNLHQIDSPDASEALDSTVAHVIEWTPADEADRVKIETEEFEHEMAGDDGLFELPAGSLRSDADKTEEDRIRVKRERKLDLSGGLSGSEIEISVRNGLDILVQPTQP